MGNTKAYFIALCIVVATVGQCYAQVDGNKIREACQISVQDDPPIITLNDARKSGFCLGFVDAILGLGNDLAEPDRFCLPNGVTLERAIRVLVKYLDEHPERTSEDALTLSLRVFKAAWPCH
jgi:hypothetical protein